MKTRATLTLAGLAALIAIAPAQIRFQTYASGFSLPVQLVPDPMDHEVMYVVQKEGLIRVVRNGVIQPGNFIDLRSSLNPNGEKFLFSLAFAPNYGKTGKAYVCYVDANVETHIHRFTRSESDPYQLDPSTGLSILSVPTSIDHWGGTIRFGPDGYLYMGTGDGSGGNDPDNNAQNPTSLHGKFLRINVNADDFPSDPLKNYGIPASNPFPAGNPLGARSEIWAFGYRNPWKWSFDMPAMGGNGAMLIGDVGQVGYEEVNYEAAGDGGRNYGWRQREGAHNTTLGGTSAFLPLVDPISEYAHSGDDYSITGGFVYRGTALPASYYGRYFYGDFVTGHIFSLQLTSGVASDLVDHTTELGSTGGLITSVDIDYKGELYVLDFLGTIKKIVPRTIAGTLILQNYGASPAGRDATIEICPVGSSTPVETHTVALDSSGNFAFASNIPAGNYDVYVKASHWLRRKLSNFAISAAGASGLNASLINGDINNNNVITISDFARLRAALNTSAGDPMWDAEADLNGNGSVTIGDFAILRANLNLQGD